MAASNRRDGDVQLNRIDTIPEHARSDASVTQVIQQGDEMAAVKIDPPWSRQAPRPVQVLAVHRHQKLRNCEEKVPSDTHKLFECCNRFEVTKPQFLFSLAHVKADFLKCGLKKSRIPIHLKW